MVLDGEWLQFPNGEWFENDDPVIQVTADGTLEWGLPFFRGIAALVVLGPAGRRVDPGGAPEAGGRLKLIVADASALVEYLLRTTRAGPVEAAVTSADADVHVPALCDVEVVSALSRALLARWLTILTQGNWSC